VRQYDGLEEPTHQQVLAAMEFQVVSWRRLLMNGRTVADGMVLYRMPSETMILIRKDAGSEPRAQETFRVPPHMTKVEISTYLEELYGLKIKKVNTVNYDGQVKARNGHKFKRRAYKTAHVIFATQEEHESKRRREEFKERQREFLASQNVHGKARRQLYQEGQKKFQEFHQKETQRLAKMANENRQESEPSSDEAKS